MTLKEISDRIHKSNLHYLPKEMTVKNVDGSKIKKPTLKELILFADYLFKNQNALSLDIVEYYFVASFPNYCYKLN